MDDKKREKKNRTHSQSRASNHRGRSRSPTENWNKKSSWKSANAFINFMKDFRKQNPDVRNHTFKVAGEKWRNMSTEEKQPYIDAANIVKSQNQKNESQKKQNIIPAYKKVVLSKASNQKKYETKAHDPSNGSDSARSSANKTERTATSGDESDN